MTVLQLWVLAAVQGITEFLPISSSGHLVLVPIFAGWEDQGLMIDVAVHVGTLGAVMLYFSRDIWAMIYGLWRKISGKRDPGGGAQLFALTVLATIPLIGGGYALNEYGHMLGEDWLRGIKVIGWTTLGFGILLYIADRIGMTVRRVEHLGISDAVIIGIAQVLALTPGTSRSGITITAARILGFERADAARFSMILSIPAILGAGTLKGWELYQSGDNALTMAAALAASLSFVTALVAIMLLMAWLKRSTFTPFVFYRIVLGAVLLGITYGIGAS